MTATGSTTSLSQTNSVQESCCGQYGLGVLVPTCLGDPGKACLSRPVSPYVEAGVGEARPEVLSSFRMLHSVMKLGVGKDEV